MSSSLKTGRLIFIGPSSSLWHQPQCNCLEPPNLLDLDATNEDVDTELVSLLNPWSGDDEWVGGCATYRSHHWWPQLWPHCCTLPQSLCDGWQICPGSSMNLSALWNLSSGGDSSLLWNINGIFTSKWEWRHPRFYCYDALFHNGLGYQWPAFLQAQWVGIELGLLTNPTDCPW